MKRANALILAWIKLWCCIKPVYLMAAIELLYAAAIYARPEIGPASYIEAHTGLPARGLAIIMALCAVALLRPKASTLWFFPLGFPLVWYSIWAVLWAVSGQGSTTTAIAANISVLILLTALYARTAWEAPNGH